MASTSSKAETAPTTLEELGRDVLQRRARLGAVEVPANSGRNRTASKRALIEAIERTGAKW
jgi:hypothetical protein